MLDIQAFFVYNNVRIIWVFIRQIPESMWRISNE